MDFDQNKIDEFYPHATMIEPMRVGSLPRSKKLTLHDVCTNGDYFANTKKDGAMYVYNRATENRSYLFGRTISTKTDLLTEKSDNVPHIINFLDLYVPVGTVLVGEIYYPNTTSKDTVKIMGCAAATAIKRQKGNLIHYYIHDILYYGNASFMDQGALKRYNLLKEIFRNVPMPSYIEIADFYDSSDVDLEELAAEQIANGEEGIVLKRKDAPYVPGKRPAWNMIKLKKNSTVDVVGIKAIPATKEYCGDNLLTWEYCIDEKTEKRLKGVYKDLVKDNPNVCAVSKAYYNNWYMAISIGAYNDDGELETIGTVSSGFDDEDRAKLKKYEGKVLTLKVMEKNKTEHTLRHPIFEQIHADKNPKECKIKEIFN